MDIRASLSIIPDPGIERGKTFLNGLQCPVIEDIAFFGETQIRRLKNYRVLPNGTPGPDTILRVSA